MPFAYRDARNAELSRLRLAPGQLSKLLILTFPAPNPERVHTVVIDNDDGVMVSELNRMASYAQTDPYRIFEIVGVRPGESKIRAWEIPRDGPAIELASVTVEVTKVQPSDPDLMYWGTYLAWLRTFPPGLGPDPLLFSASSGLPGSQVAREQSNKDHGPIPEGRYTFRARIDPLQSSVSQANSREGIATRDGALSITNMDEGVQFLPIGGNGPVYPDWGTLRVRLTAIGGVTFGRGGFFLHNSHKGFSHGCIEVGAGPNALDFFSTLVRYAARPESPKEIFTLGVKYTYPDQITLGDTLRRT